jgi:dCMP deaminase
MRRSYMEKRPTWDEYFMGIAEAVAKRASCPRRSVGVVITADNRILSTGYNGAPAGKPHCLSEGCIIIDDHCKRARHAEINAIEYAKNKLDLYGATLYCTGGCPCPYCAWEIDKARIQRVVFSGEMHKNGTIRLLERLKIQVESLRTKGGSK